MNNFLARLRLTALCACLLQGAICTACSAAQTHAPPLPNAVWTRTADDMRDERWAPGACVLKDGRHALIAGGYSYDAGGCVGTIDIYDEQTNRFRLSHARLSYPRDFVQANLLANGDVLLSGGFSDIWASMNVADLYDPATDTCRPTIGRMHQHRELMTAITLKDGRVILIGGLDLWARGTVATAEIYDPATEQFTLTAGHLRQDRFGQAACLLADGRAFVVGGTHWSLHTGESKVLDSAEIYDPATDRFTLCAGHLSIGRDRPTANLLPNGDVLVYGGQGPGGEPVTTAEIYDPAADAFTTLPAPPQEPRMAHASVTLTDGNILVAGGWDAQIKGTTPTDMLIEAITGLTVDLAPLPFASHDAAMVVFPDDRVLVAGGKTIVNGQTGSTAEAAVRQF